MLGEKLEESGVRPTGSNLVESKLESSRLVEDPTLPSLAHSLSGILPVESESSNLRDLSFRRKPRLWAVGGGKGGVGKSLISASFSLSLAKRGRRTVAVDLDLGGANLHTCLGIEPPRVGVGDWAGGRMEDLEGLMIKTFEPNLRMISGSNDSLKIIPQMEQRRVEFFEQLRKIDADDIIVDLGAGTQDLTVEFFTLADVGILSILPEPTSVENAYRFIRAAIYRKLRQAEVPAGIREVIDAATDQKNVLGIRTPADLFAILERLDPAATESLRRQLAALEVHIVINQVRSPVDIDVGRAICSVCRRYFGVDIHYSGYLDYDNSVWRAVREKKPVMKEFPHSILANRIDRLTRTLLGEQKGLFP
jgi:flagellar biosynthesis protein FlhG